MNFTHPKEPTASGNRTRISEDKAIAQVSIKKTFFSAWTNLERFQIVGQLWGIVVKVCMRVMFNLRKGENVKNINPRGEGAQLGNILREPSRGTNTKRVRKIGHH